MRWSVALALFAFLATVPFLSAPSQARVERPCPAFGRPCECARNVRHCLPTCQIQLQLECVPT
jgi:hypothetical protein